MRIYKSISEVSEVEFRHVIAGAFFQLQHSCIQRIPEINKLTQGEVLFVDVYPGQPSHQFLLSASEKEMLFKQLGVKHYLSLPLEEWVVFFNRLKRKNTCENGIYNGPFFLSGLNETQIDISILKDFMVSAFDETDMFGWHRQLGYYYPLSGIVVYGNKMGRKLGYPTLNIKPVDIVKLIPPMGVYSGLVRHSSNWYKAMINIGIRPTLDLNRVTIEAHLFNFSEEIYDETVTIHFVERLRDEMRFPSLDHLKARLKIDQKLALQSLDKMNPVTHKGENFVLAPRIQ